MIFGSSTDSTPRRHLRAFVDAWVITVMVATVIVGAVFIYQGQSTRASLLVLFWLPSLIGWRRLAAGRARSGAQILVYGYAFALALSLTLYNGIYAPAVAMLPILAIVAAVLLGPAHGLWLGFSSGLLLIVLAIMSALNLPIPVQVPPQPFAILTVELCLLMMSASFAFHASKAIRLRIDTAVEQKQDLSQQVERGHAELLDTQQRLERIAETAPGGIFQWLLMADGSSSFPYVNSRVVELSGIGADTLAKDARILIERFHPDDWTPISTDEINKLRFGRRVRTRTVGDGWMWIRILASGETKEAGSVLWSGFVNDVSKQVAVERELEAARAAAEAANQAKSAFLAHMSHEIRTPMNGVLGMSELLAQTSLDERQSEYINTVRNSGRNLMEVIDSILDFSKIEAGKMEVRPVSFGLSGLMREVVSLYSAVALEKGLELSSSRQPTGELRLLADRSLIYRILTNLVSNAVKFTEAGSVKLSCRWNPVENGQVSVEFLVSDTGPGIDQAQRHRLFEAFSQLQPNDEATSKGTGLGLALCKQCTDLIGGALQLLDGSEPGAQFQLCFLAGISDDGGVERTNTAKPALQQLPQFSGRTLVAEDEPVNQAVVSSMLASLGMGVELADDGAEALAMAEALDPDVLLLDCQMPNLDGYAVARALRAHDTLHTLPIIALTAHAFADNAERAFAAGVDVFLTKPITRLSLAQALWTLGDYSEGIRSANFISSPLWCRPKNASGAEWAQLAEQFCSDQGLALLDVLRECVQADDTDAVHALCAKLAQSSQAVGALRLARTATAYAEPDHPWMVLDVERLPAIFALFKVTTTQLSTFVAASAAH